MLKISKKLSVTLSRILTVVVFALLVAALPLLPSLLSFLIKVFLKPEDFFWPTLILLYAVLIPAFTADVSLYLLLRNVESGRIFTAQSVLYLRILSWCCMLAGVLFFALGFYYLMVFLLAFAAIFMGIILRVVKNVIEEAAEIKSENDFTI